MLSESALVAEFRHGRTCDPGTVPAATQERRSFLSFWVTASAIGLALWFVVLGVENLDLGPAEARLGLAAGEEAGPLGQVFGYWAADLWPAQVLPSLLLARFETGNRPTSGSVRWPAALAGILVGLILTRGASRALSGKAAVLGGICWFGCIALIDRSAGIGVDVMMGLGLLGAIARLIERGSDLTAGLWASLAFLAGGWPPLVLIGLAIIVMGRATARFSARLLLPPLVAAALWSVWTVWSSSPLVLSEALRLPLFQKPAWWLVPGVFALGLPFSPMALLVASGSVRESWNSGARAHVRSWCQVTAACLIAGTLVPGLASAAKVAALGGLAVVGGACLEAVWTGNLAPTARHAFLLLFSIIVAAWLAIMSYGSFIWCVVLPYYRPLGIAIGFCVIAVALLAWSALAPRNLRRGVLCLVVVAAGLKLAHWGYYVPEWNYRHSQGPSARAIAQWIPAKWTLYTIHDWPADLAFYLRRPVRQLRGAEFLRYQAPPESKFVLLLPSEFENWPDSALRVSLVARFQDQSGGERVLARTAGVLPPPFGPNLVRLGYAHREVLSSIKARSRN